MIAAWFLVALIALFSLSMLNWRNLDALGASVMLALIWACCMVLAALYEPPDSMGLYPVLDAMGGASAMVIWFRRPALWKLALAGCFLVQCVLHVAFWWFGFPPLSQYARVLDILFALQIACVGAPGAWNVVSLAAGRLGVSRRASPGASSLSEAGR